MSRELKELDGLLSDMVTRATTEKDRNQLRTILKEYLFILGEDPVALELEGFDLELKGYDLTLEDLNLELEPMKLELEPLKLEDPCPKTKKEPKK